MMENEKDGNRFLNTLDRFLLGFGKTIAWCNGILIVVIVLQVTLRYGFSSGFVMLEELEWYLYSIAFMFGLSYAATTDAHVRVDLISSRFPIRVKHYIEVFGALFLMLPFIVTVIIHGYAFFLESWIHNERSTAPLGLPWRWAIKAVIPISFGFFGVAILSQTTRSLLFLFGKNHGNK